jgi:hypothetical protein
LRQEHDDATDAGNDTIGKKTADRAIRQIRGEEYAQKRGAGLDCIHQRCGPGKHGLKNNGHNDK